MVNNQLISFKSALSLHQSGFRANHNFSYCISCKQYFIRFGQWDTLCCPFYRSVKSISCRWSCFGLTEAMQYILIERLVIGFRIICLIDFSVCPVLLVKGVPQGSSLGPLRLSLSSAFCLSQQLNRIFLWYLVSAKVVAYFLIPRLCSWRTNLACLPY